MIDKVIIENYQEHICCEFCQERYRVDFDCPMCGKFSKNAPHLAEDGCLPIDVLYCNHCEYEFKRTEEWSEDCDQYWQPIKNDD